MKILAIDPGYERLGIAVLEIGGKKETLLFSECFITSRDLSHEDRLEKVGERIRKLIKDWKPEEVAIEELFFNENQKTALLVAQAFGVVIYEAARAELAVSLYTPLQVKIATTGYGRSTKDQVIDMVKRLIEIKKTKALDDEYDAIAVGLTHVASRLGRIVRKNHTAAGKI